MAETEVSTSIRVLIADDHQIVRQGLEVVLENYDDVILVGEAEDGEQAVRLATELKPDVIVMDIQMPVKDGITAIQEITSINPKVRILVLTSYPDDDMVYQAIKEGAVGYFLKDTRSEQLVEAIRTVHRGEVALQPIIARKLLLDIKKPPSYPKTEEPLTSREVDVIQYLAQGYSNQQIAQELSISVRTAATHVRNILGKLQLANRTQAALYAVEKKIAPK